MKEILIYISQVSLLLVCSYLCYVVIFVRGTSHNVKRFVLLLFTACSFLLPLCRATIHREVVVPGPSVEATIIDQQSASGANIVSVIQPNINAMFDWWILLAIIYFTGFLAVIMRQIIGVYKVYRLIRKKATRVVHNDCEIFIIEKNIQAFNFFGKIVIPISHYDENAHIIINHEQIHTRHAHWIDILFMNIASSLQWFNPVVWLIRSELLLAHEYTADRGVIESGIDAKTYQYLLISKVVPRNDFHAQGSHFRGSDLRKRIKIMKRETSKWASSKLLLIIPLAGLAIVSLADVKYHVTSSVKTSTPKIGQFHMPYQGKIMSRRTTTNETSTEKKAHIAIDVIVSNDTIRAPYHGVVSVAEYLKDGRGNTLSIVHGDSLQTSYSHLAKFLVDKGEKVEGGQAVAIVGNTGRSTGKHLHMECRMNGKLVDPHSVLPLN